MKGRNKAADAAKYKSLCIRVLAAIILMTLAGGLCYLTYYLTESYERQSEEDEFDSIAARLREATLRSMSDKIRALESTSALVSLMCPDYAIWPNCTVPMKYYFNATDPLITISGFRTIGFTPIVKSDQLSEFEAFAYETYNKGGYPGIGLSSFGKGVYAVNESTGAHFHTTEPPALNNKHQILTPVMQLGQLNVNREAIMLNHYYHPKRITSIDILIQCFLENNGTANSDCVVVTDVIQLVVDPDFRPSLVIFIPIAAEDKPDTMVGMTYGTMNWDAALSNAVPGFVDGIVVVVSGGEVDHTFTIQNGQAVFSSIGDEHDSNYDATSKYFYIPFFAGSIEYKVTVYGSPTFSKQYRTLLPLFLTGVTLGVIIMLSFMIYTFWLRRLGEHRDLVENTKRLFVRFISHEIRTPMNIVHLGLKLIANEMEDCIKKYSNSTAPETIFLLTVLRNWVNLTEEVELSSNDAILVLNDLLNYDKITLGGMTIEKLPVNMWDILVNSVRPFLVQARGSDVTVTLSMSTDQDGLTDERRRELFELVLIGDSVKITQVFRNILSNALKFTPAGGTVDISAVYVPNGLSSVDYCDEEQDGLFSKTGSIRICVKDSGYGISADDLQNLFKEGLQFRANQLQAGGGSGLGLWIAKGITELHRGTLVATSAGEGKGTTFLLELPVGNMHLAKKASARISAKNVNRVIPENNTHAVVNVEVNGAKSDHTLNVVNLLCVDDSAPSRKLMVKMLQRCGYTCYQACDGIDCLEKVKLLTDEGIAIDAVLMDYEMPNLNGPDATRELIKRGCNSVVIGITGNVLPEDIKTFVDSGAYDVLGKPLIIEQLERLFSRYKAQFNN